MWSFCCSMPSGLLPEVEFVTVQNVRMNQPCPLAMDFRQDRSAICLLVQALSCSRSVDFPTVTDICELRWNDPPQTQEVVEILVTAMQQGNDLTQQLKAATVAHELLYDSCARKAMFENSDMLQALSRLGTTQSPSEDGPAEEAVRLLSSETRRRLLEEFDFYLEL
mmetsp:Transcript_59212/g.157617  ORF Transcript_59212/g.157617 Transcript_59212/m.157617 type:complete len:166 (-) Transcript_59212:173-670(-)